MKRNKPVILGFMAGLMLFSGCASNRNTTASDAAPSSGMQYSKMYDEGYELAQEAGIDYEVSVESDLAGETFQAEKLVKTGDMEISVGDFEGTIESVYNTIEEAGGFVENYYQYISSVNSRDYKNASLTLKIPAEKFDEIKVELSSLGTVRSYGDSVDNITNQYYDTQARLDVKQAERDRLMELLETAQSVEDIIAIEARLSEVNTDIDILESRMKSMDRDVTYATMYLYVNENPNESIQPVGGNIGSRIRNSFTGSVNFVIDAAQWILLAAVWLSVPLTVCALVLGTGFVVYRKIKKK